MKFFHNKLKFHTLVIGNQFIIFTTQNYSFARLFLTYAAVKHQVILKLDIHVFLIHSRYCRKMFTNTYILQYPSVQVGYKRVIVMQISICHANWFYQNTSSAWKQKWVCKKWNFESWNKKCNVIWIHKQQKQVPCF